MLLVRVRPFGKTRPSSSRRAMVTSIASGAASALEVRAVPPGLERNAVGVLATSKHTDRDTENRAARVPPAIGLWAIRLVEQLGPGLVADSTAEASADEHNPLRCSAASYNAQSARDQRRFNIRRQIPKFSPGPNHSGRLSAKVILESIFFR